MKEETKKTTVTSVSDGSVKEQKVDSHEERMLERWAYTANGYTFTVRPVMLGEEPEFLNDLKASPVPAKIIEEGVMPTDKELGRWAITLFSEPLNSPMQDSKEKKSLFERVKIFFFTKILRRKDYNYYEDFPAVQPVLKWIERKVTYENKPVLFYDLERKFQLNKAEVEKLFIFLYQISGF